MAQNVHTTDDFGGVKEWYKSIPPVTKILGSIWAVSAVAYQIGLLPLKYLWLEPRPIFRRLQLWRLVTNVGFLGGFSPHFAIRMIWLCIYSPVLERTMIEYNPGEFAYCMLFSLLTLDVMGMFSPLARIYFTAGPLVFTIMYLWSREFPSQEISIYGLIRIKAFYLPWAMLAVEMMFGNPALMADLTGNAYNHLKTSVMMSRVGIAVGHLYYFLKTIYPSQSGRYWLKCPLWLTRFMAKYYKTSQPTPPTGRQNNQGQTGGGGFQAFRGTARRLQD